MKSTRFILALALLLAAQTAARADLTPGFRGPDEFASDNDHPNPGGYYVVGFKSVDDRASFTAIAVTILLTTQGQLVRPADVKPMTSMAECRAWTHQQEFMRVLPGYLAAFHYCDYASAP